MELQEQRACRKKGRVHVKKEALVRRRRAKRARRAGNHLAAEADRVRGRRAGEGSDLEAGGGRGATAERGSGRAAGDDRDRGAGEGGGQQAGEGGAPREGGRDPPAGEGKEVEVVTGSPGVAEGPGVKTRNLKRAEKGLKAETSQRVLRKRI